MLVMYAKQSHAKNEVFIRNPQIWSTNAQVEIFISNHEERCFNTKMKSISWVLIKMQVQARMGLSMSWEVWWRKSFPSLEKCVSSRSEKWWSEWKVEFWNMEVFLSWKFWFVNTNFPKWTLYHLFLIKIVFVFLTSKLLSHSLKENGANEAQAVEIWGLYTCIGWKVGQKTPNID